jgi:hypothetical protein
MIGLERIIRQLNFDGLVTMNEVGRPQGNPLGPACQKHTCQKKEDDQL